MTDNPHGGDSVGAGFDESAGNYDDLLIHNRTGAARLVAALPDAVYERIIDVGCGTGFATLEMHARRGTTRAVGVDASPEMLEVFRRTAAQVEGLDAQLHVGDAAALPADEGSMDAAISTMAFHWFPDKQTALGQMARAVKPGGIVAVLTAGRGTDGELLQVMRRMDPPVPVAWTAVFDYIHRDVPEMHAMLDVAGLEPIDVWAETRYRWIDPVNYMARLQAVAAHLSSDMPPEVAIAHGERLTRALHEASGPKGFAYTFVKLFAIARKPVSSS